MKDLPFEHDSIELIEACAQALVPIELHEKTPAPAAKTVAQTEAYRGLDTLRLPAEQTLSTQLLTTETEQVLLRDLPLPSAIPADAEAVSRAVERDARRFEK